ncbi:MAG TPA: nucleotide exchange factor GrpE [Verrucomicrobiae bacterium]|nr:nucleotide exchange factor GrpE [Verrucomicrobiae bacterium]
MNAATKLKVPKLPFLIGDLLLLGFAYFIIWRSPHPIGEAEILACFAAAALGAVVGTMPFILDYRAACRLLEVNALGAVAEKIQNLEKLAAQIGAATNEWVNAQMQAEKTSAGAKQITDRMAAEVQGFSEFMDKMNDREKAALRLEVEKLRRGEVEWLQVLVRVLDHVFALHAAAVRTGDPKFAEPLTNFQNACRGTVRRIGLTPFVAAPNEPFNPERHRTADNREKPPGNAVVAETVSAGYTFQGRVLRPALVKLREGNPPADKRSAEPELIEAPENQDAESEFSSQTPD